MSLKNLARATADDLLTRLIDQNPSLLNLLYHFGAGMKLHGKRVSDICQENDISLPLFLLLTDLYNGFTETNQRHFSAEEIPSILRYLQASHTFYKEEKYPELKKCIEDLRKVNNSEEIRLVEIFFRNYFQEVLQHLAYEDCVVFPYIQNLLAIQQGQQPAREGMDFSSSTYLRHHTDIESKLADLKNLLLQYIPQENDRTPRRKLLLSLYELEFELHIHSLVEEQVLVPLINTLEIQGVHGQ